jgi:hypothetical protein
MLTTAQRLQLEYRLKEAASSALMCQDACNLSGLVYSFNLHMQTICDASREFGHGTDWRNNHPVAILFTYKMAALTGQEPVGSDLYEMAYSDCSDIAEGKRVAS